MTDESRALAKAKEQGVEAVVNRLFSTKTPQKFIKSRPGSGGQIFRYVEIGYVINELNKAFGPFWEFKVVDKGIGKKQIWVQGQLTVKTKDGFSITKETFGGADIKISKATGEAIDIANDLKAAVSDCTKKCASMFGIAADVFFKEQSQYDQMETVVDTEDLDDSTKQIVMRKYFVVASERGFDGEAAKKKIKDAFKVEHMEDLTINDLERGIKALETKYQVVMPGEEPLAVGEYRKKPEPIDTIPSIDVIEKEQDEALQGQVVDESVDVDEVSEAIDKQQDISPGCRQCGVPIPEERDTASAYFCSQSCQDKYYPAKRTGLLQA